MLMADPITKEQYEHWRRHPVTRKLHEVILEARAEAQENLSNFNRPAQAEPSDDKLRGLIKGLDTVVEWEPF
jgi:hypothetical protein